MDKIISKRKLLPLSLAVILCNSAVAQTHVIHAGELLSIPGEKPLMKQTIVIEDDKIVSVEDGYIPAKNFGDDATLVDLSNSFVMPGLMDMHVHLQMELGAHNTKDALQLSDADLAMQSVHFAKKTLLAGFTTVRDLLSEPEEMYALRDAIKKGWIDGPRIIAGAGVSITGGHLDVDGMSPEILELKSAKTICDGPIGVTVRAVGTAAASRRLKYPLRVGFYPTQILAPINR